MFPLQRNTPENWQVLAPKKGADKDLIHRLKLFAEWLSQNDGIWYRPDLNTYRDYLLKEYTGRDNQSLSAASVRAHLSSVRGHYQALLRDNRLRDAIYAMTPKDASPADRKSFVDEMIQRIHNDIDPDNAAVKIIRRQDTSDETHIRLSADQAAALLQSPGTNTLIGLRDTAVIALMLCTGIREAELCALDVPDLRRKLSGESALHIRRGKGSKERLVPYGTLIWVLDMVDRWLQKGGISEGAVFRGFYKTGKRVRNSRLTVRSINKILDRYPLMLNGELRTVNPHDLRRTYARRLYESGMDLLAIRDNLGHADSRTTLKYIGVMDVDKRKPPAIYENPFAQE